MTTERFSSGLSAHGTRFSEWRAVRPFLGGALLALGGITIAAQSTFLAAGSVVSGFTVIGLVAAAAAFLCGTFALAKPALAGTLGAVGVIAAIVSLVGTGSMGFVGVVLSLFGGNLCYAWQPDADAEN